MSEARTGSRQGERNAPTVAVVGAGVSGCACAAVLASKGVLVTVLNSALDAVGMPGYGPEMVAGVGGWREIAETMAALPLALRKVWLNAAAVPENGAPLLTVDRRAVSIETKRALEGIPGLGFRQGLVTNVRMVSAQGAGSGDLDDGRVAVETIFGEVIEADAVVLAVGLGLGGHVTVGTDVLPGGRYGEIPADGLRSALEAMGATFREVSMQVGARFSSRRPALLRAVVRGSGRENARRSITIRTLLGGLHGSPEGPPYGGSIAGGSPELQEARRALMGESSVTGLGDGSGGAAVDPTDRWPDGYPPAPHWTDELRFDHIVLDETKSGTAVPLLSPDGIATAETHLSVEAARIAGLGVEGREGAALDDEGPASRLGHVVCALAIASIDPGGRLTAGPAGRSRIWVAGRAAGAVDYLSSLRSGARVADEVAGVLVEGRPWCPHDCPDGSEHRSTGPGASDRARVDSEVR